MVWTSLAARGRGFLALQILTLIGIATTLYLSRGRLAEIPLRSYLPGHRPSHNGTTGTLQQDSKVSAVLDAIMDPTMSRVPRLECPGTLDEFRYAPLKLSPSTPHSSLAAERLAYFFAIDLRNSIDVLPRLLGTVVEAIRFLGPASCALSIVEGHSSDGTLEVLRGLERSIGKGLGTAFYLTSNDTLDSKYPGGDHVGSMAELRNAALAPLLQNPLAGPDTTVIFLDAVVICPEDVLELALQRKEQEADMMCAMDWEYVQSDSKMSFHDVWVARTLSGNTFFEIPPDGSWDQARDLFPSKEDEESRARFEAHKPFQVFSCWNGAAVFSAAPLLPGRRSISSGGSNGKSGWGKFSNETAAAPVNAAGLKFRGPHDVECQHRETQLFCKDLWSRGHGRIGVVPSVNLAYGDVQARKVKLQRPTTSRVVADADKIKWREEPPASVKCMPGFKNQSWRPWNETLLEQRH